MVAFGLVTGIVALFRSATGEPVAEIRAHRDSVNAVAFSAGGRILASGGRDRTVGFWDLNEASPSEVLRIPSPSGRPVLSVKFSPDGGTLGMLLQNEAAVRLWNLIELRSRLKNLGLDWNDRPPVLDESESIQPRMKNG